MKIHALPRILATTALALAALSLVPADAHARGRSTSVHGARGGYYQRQVSRTPGHLSASRSATLPDGRTAGRSVDSQRTDTGRTTSARATGFDGRTATYDATRTRTDTGYQRQVNATGPNGATASKQVDVSNQNGTVTRTVTRTATPPTS